MMWYDMINKPFILEPVGFRQWVSSSWEALVAFVSFSSSCCCCDEVAQVHREEAVAWHETVLVALEPLLDKEPSSHPRGLLERDQSR